MTTAPPTPSTSNGTPEFSAPSPLRIREAHAEDDARIGDLLVNAFVTGYARKMPEVLVGDARKSDLRNVAVKRESGCVLVAESTLNGELLGTVTLMPPGHANSRAWRPGLADLRYLAIDPRAQGKGLAAPLLERTVEVARRWGANAICLHVRRGAHGVAGVYLRNGYQRAPEGDQDLLPEIYLEAFLRVI